MFWRHCPQHLWHCLLASILVFKGLTFSVHDDSAVSLLKSSDSLGSLGTDKRGVLFLVVVVFLLLPSVLFIRYPSNCITLMLEHLSWPYGWQEKVSPTNQVGPCSPLPILWATCPTLHSPYNVLLSLVFFYLLGLDHAVPVSRMPFLLDRS